MNERREADKADDFLATATVMTTGARSSRLLLNELFFPRATNFQPHTTSIMFSTRLFRPAAQLSSVCVFSSDVATPQAQWLSIALGQQSNKSLTEVMATASPKVRLRSAQERRQQCSSLWSRRRGSRRRRILCLLWQQRPRQAGLGVDGAGESKCASFDGRSTRQGLHWWWYVKR